MTLPIYSHPPNTWKELQDMVAKIFADIGYQTFVEHTVKLARGTASLDVLAEKYNRKSSSICIVECKYWNRKVNKNTVHAFRTIVSEYGANIGYIICKDGFQKGALEAIERTNVVLLTFQEFLDEFKIEWLEKVVDSLGEEGYPLIKYADPLDGFCHYEVSLLNEAKQIEYNKLCNKYFEVSLSSQRALYKNVLTGQLYLNYIDQDIIKYSNKFPEDIKINSLMEYFDYLISICKKGTKEFDNLFGKKLRKET